MRAVGMGGSEVQFCYHLIVCARAQRVLQSETCLCLTFFTSGLCLHTHCIFRYLSSGSGAADSGLVMVCSMFRHTALQPYFPKHVLCFDNLTLKEIVREASFKLTKARKTILAHLKNNNNLKFIRSLFTLL